MLWDSKLTLGWALLAMGINWHFPQAVMHRPQSHNRLEIPNLFMEQLIAHILMLIKFWPQKEDPTSHLIQANMEAFRLKAGLSRQIFRLLHTILPYITRSWFTQTWQHCKELDIDLTTNVKDFEIPHQNDRELMKIILHSGSLDKT